MTFIENPEPSRFVPDSRLLFEGTIWVVENWLANKGRFLKHLYYIGRSCLLLDMFELFFSFVLARIRD